MNGGCGRRRGALALKALRYLAVCAVQAIIILAVLAPRELARLAGWLLVPVAVIVGLLVVAALVAVVHDHRDADRDAGWLKPRNPRRGE